MVFKPGQEKIPITRPRVCFVCQKEFIPNTPKHKMCLVRDEVHLKIIHEKKRLNRYNSHNLRGKFTSKKRIQRRQYWLTKYKVARGCDECGWNAHSCALDWDHLDVKTKNENVSRLISGSLELLFNEIRKCRLLCSNHHRIVTYNNMSYRKRQIIDTEKMGPRNNG